MIPTVAALYIDPRGPYPSMPGVDCWDADRLPPGTKRDTLRRRAAEHDAIARQWARLAEGS